MPKTKFQSAVFTLIMVFFMVFCMTLYSISLNNGALQYMTFLIALKEMWIEYVIVFCLVFFGISKIAPMLAFRILNPKEDKPIFITLAIQSFTVCCVVPTITLIATFLHNGLQANWFTQWLTTAFRCFPVALMLQIFFVGPFVRFIFRIIFKKQLSA